MKFLGLISFIWKIYIGIVFAVTLIIFYPILLLILQFNKLKSWTFYINVLWSRIIRIFCFYAVNISDANSHIPNPIIICANHTSYLDIFLMYSILPKNKFLFLGKAEILSYPLIRQFFKNLNIPVFRGDRIKSAQSLIRARNEIKNNWSIVIFPEGGIPWNTPVLNQFKVGAFKLAISAQSPILPISFRDNYHLFSDPEDIWGIAHPGLCNVVFHPIIDKDQIQNSSEEELSMLTFNLINSSLK